MSVRGRPCMSYAYRTQAVRHPVKSNRKSNQQSTRSPRPNSKRTTSSMARSLWTHTAKVSTVPCHAWSASGWVRYGSGAQASSAVTVRWVRGPWSQRSACRPHTEPCVASMASAPPGPAVIASGTAVSSRNAGGVRARARSSRVAARAAAVAAWPAAAAPGACAAAGRAGANGNRGAACATAAPVAAA